MSKVEQLEVQLAGCGVAALGHIQDPAKLGDYGWSHSYEDVLRLRRRFDKLYRSLRDASADQLPSEVVRALSEVREDMGLTSTSAT